MPMRSSGIMFWKRVLYKSVHIYAYIHVYEKLFSKTWSMNLASALQTHLLEWCLSRFGKEHFNIYIIYIIYNIYIHALKRRKWDHVIWVGRAHCFHITLYSIPPNSLCMISFPRMLGVDPWLLPYHDNRCTHTCNKHACPLFLYALYNFDILHQWNPDESSLSQSTQSANCEEVTRQHIKP